MWCCVAADLCTLGSGSASAVQIRAWRQYQIKDKFILERHLKKGSIFIAGDQQQVYLVSGITSPLSDMIFAEMLPLILETVIMPFKGKIVYVVLAFSFLMYFLFLKNKYFNIY
jgi:hypothetical protein